jgi:hypothetical protein
VLVTKPLHGIAGGVVKLFGVECDEGVAGCGMTLGVVSINRGKADHVVPDGEAGGTVKLTLIMIYFAKQSQGK